MLAVRAMSVTATASDPVFPGAVVALVLQIAQLARSATCDQRQHTFVLARHRPAERFQVLIAMLPQIVGNLSLRQLVGRGVKVARQFANFA